MRRVGYVGKMTMEGKGGIVLLRQGDGETRPIRIRDEIEQETLLKTVDFVLFSRRLAQESAATGEGRTFGI